MRQRSGGGGQYDPEGGVYDEEELAAAAAAYGYHGEDTLPPASGGYARGGAAGAAALGYKPNSRKTLRKKATLTGRRLPRWAASVSLALRALNLLQYFLSRKQTVRFAHASIWCWLR